jgi:peptide/nickel transport system permease protein
VSSARGNDVKPPVAPSRRRRLVGYAVRRLLFVPIGSFVLVLAAFLIVNLVPSNPGYQILGDNATPEQIRAINTELGWDRPLPAKFATYLGDLAQGDLGVTFYQNEKVSSAILRHLPNTVELVVPALVLALVIGVSLAIVSIRGPRFLRRPASGSITVLQAVPEFLIAVVLIYFLFVRTHVAPPPVGRAPLGVALPPDATGFLLVDSLLAGDWSLAKEVVHHLMLPVMTLGLGISPLFGRVAHSMLLRAWQAPYVEFARSNGHSNWRILRFVVRDIRGSILTYFVAAMAALVGGSAIVETIFSWNGIGRWGVSVMAQMDIPAIQGFVLVTTLAALLLYVVLDIVVAALDPRVELGGKALA